MRCESFQLIRFFYFFYFMASFYPLGQKQMRQTLRVKSSSHRLISVELHCEVTKESGTDLNEKHQKNIWLLWYNTNFLFWFKPESIIFYFIFCSLGLLGDKKFCFQVEMITAQHQFRQTNRRLCRASRCLLVSAELLGENLWLIPAENQRLREFPA